MERGRSRRGGGSERSTRISSLLWKIYVVNSDPRHNPALRVTQSGRGRCWETFGGLVITPHYCLLALAGSSEQVPSIKSPETESRPALKAFVAPHTRRRKIPRLETVRSRCDLWPISVCLPPCCGLLLKLCKGLFLTLTCVASACRLWSSLAGLCSGTPFTTRFLSRRSSW